MRLTAKLQYFLLLDSGKKKSNTVTALVPGPSQVTFIYIALLTIQIVSKQLHNIKTGKCLSFFSLLNSVMSLISSVQLIIPVHSPIILRG